MGTPVTSSLFQSLDGVLGRLSHIRVLRVLALHGGALTPPELALRSGMSRAGAWNALDALEAIGIVARVGTGTTVPFTLNEGHPLTGSIRRLYEDEASRADGVLEEIRTAARALDPPPLGVWLFGSVARGEDRAESDLDIAVVAEDEAAARLQAARLRESLSAMPGRYAVRPSVISLSASEVVSLRDDGQEFWQRIVQDGVPLLGPPPEDFRATA